MLAACLLMAHPDQRPPTAQSEPILQSFVEGHGRTLVLVGGGTQGAAAFAPHAKALADDYTVVRLQTLNIESAEQRRPLPAGYELKTESRAMLRALDGLGIRDPVDIVGWSFGALVAIDFALDHPERVRSLVLHEPPAFWVVPEQERQSDPAMKEMIALLAQLDPTGTPSDDQFRRFRCALNNCPARVPTASDPEWPEWNARRPALRGLSAIATHRDDVTRLKQFDRPVLLLTGSSTVSFHRRINELLAAALPHVERAELAGGHAAPVSARDAFLTRVKQFLASQ